MMTFGAPSRARSGLGHAGVDTSGVRPITPENAAPDSYSFNVDTVPSVFGTPRSRFAGCCPIHPIATHESCFSRARAVGSWCEQC
jgi:hypothetical protein